MKDKEAPPGGGISRRGFLKGAGLTVAAGTLIGTGQEGLALAARPGRADVLRANQRHTIRMLVNGRNVRAVVSTGDTLMDVLRFRLDLTGAKPVCDMGSCGACTVILNGAPVTSCMVLAVDLQGAVVGTVEGLAKDGKLHPVQQAFIDDDATQCGFCTPGMIMSCKALIDANPSPDRKAVRQAISGNICRCGTYQNIFRAMDRVGAANRRGN